MKAFLYHFHGLGDFDLSSIGPADLPAVQRLAAEADYELLPTIYLRPENLGSLAELLAEYHRLHDAGELPNIAGFAVEGPLLGPQGGIPRSGRWFPTTEEWRTLAGLGLRYIVMAPDGAALDEPVGENLTFADLLLSFYEQDTRVALGHFYRDDPQRSARRTRQVIEFLHDRYESSPNLVLTDHLYNDMPRNFVHTWRTPRERERRAEQLAPVLDADWETADLSELLGAVPATMLQAARERLIMPCLNFDGGHVDLDICRRTFDYLGSDRLIALTDHTEVDMMADERLRQDTTSGLWLRDDGAVAAGSADFERQRKNMLEIGLSEEAIESLFVTNPSRAIAYRPVSRANGK